MKHGIFAREALITTGAAAESAANFDAFDRALRTQAAPQGALEQLLVEQLIAFAWRWRRVLRFEHAAIASQVDKAIDAAHFNESVRDPTALYGINLDVEQRDLPAELEAADAPDPLAEDIGLCGHALAEDNGAPVDELLGPTPHSRTRLEFDPALVRLAIAAACDRNDLSRDAFWALARPSVEALRAKVVSGIEAREPVCAQPRTSPPSRRSPNSTGSSVTRPTSRVSSTERFACSKSSRQLAVFPYPPFKLEPQRKLEPQNPRPNPSHRRGDRLPHKSLPQAQMQARPLPSIALPGVPPSGRRTVRSTVAGRRHMVLAG